MKQHPCVSGNGVEMVLICGIHMNSLGKSKLNKHNHADLKNKQTLPDLIILLCKITEATQTMVKTEW